MSLLTNKGKEAISTAISSSSQFSLVRIGFGDKQGSINRKFVESDTSLVNEKFRINLDSVYYLPTVDNNTILKITANLTPEQSATMEAVTVREFGIYDNFNNLLIVGDTVPTITKDSNNNNGIDFEINLTLPTSEKVAKVLVTSKEGEFSNAERIKLNNIEKRPYFMGRFQDENEMLSLFFYDGNEEDGKKLIYNDMYYYNIGLNSVMYYNGGTWIKGNNLNIVDDLNSTVPGSVLDANQGRILKGLIDNITTMLNSDETSLDTIQEIVDFIKINRDTLNALTISSIAGLQNALNNKLDKNQNAISATKLKTARTIGGVSFDGTANINLPGVNTAGNQSTTGNSATATKLATPVKINNKFFDGSTNINLEEDAMVVKEKVVNLTGDDIQTSLGSVFIKTITEDTTLSLTTSYNIGETNSFILELTNGGNYTITWWDNIKWNGGVAPELTNNGKDILGFYSYGSPRVTVGVVLSKDVK